MSRILAIDYGEVRTGIAVTDQLQIIASGLITVKTEDLIKFLIDYTHKEQVELFIVGLPKQMNNTESESEKHILNFLKQLKISLPKIPVKRIDERFTSKIAHQTMIDSGMKKKTAKK